MGPLNRHEIIHSVLIRHRTLEAHQISSRAEEQEPRRVCLADSEFRQTKLLEAVGRERERTFSHIPRPHFCPSSEKADGWSDVQNPKKCSPHYTWRRSGEGERSSITMTETPYTRLCVDTNSSSSSLLLLSLTRGAGPQRKLIFQVLSCGLLRPSRGFLWHVGWLKDFVSAFHSLLCSRASPFYFTTLYCLTKHATVFICLRNSADLLAQGQLTFDSLSPIKS